MRWQRLNFQTHFFRLMWLLLLLPLILTTVAPESFAAIDRDRKNLLKIQLKTDKKRGKSRIVMRLNQGGYYETEEDREQQKFIIRLFDFHNYGARPIKVVDDPIVKGVNIIQLEQYLEIAVYLRIVSYNFKVSLFESPAMCVVDIKAVEPLAEKKPEITKPSSPKTPETSKTAAADAITLPDTDDEKGVPAKSQLALAVSKAVVKTAPAAKAGAPDAVIPEKSEPPISEKVIPEIKPEIKPEVHEKVPDKVADAGKKSDIEEQLSEPENKLEKNPESESETKTAAKNSPQPVESADGNRPETVSTAAPSTPETEPIPVPVKVVPEKPVMKPEPAKKADIPPVAIAVPEPEPIPAPIPTPELVVTEKPSAPEHDQKPQPGQELFDQGLKAYQDADFADAEDFFNQVFTSFPDSPLGISAQFRSYDAKAQAALDDNGSRSQMSDLVDEFLAAIRAHVDHQDAPWALLQVARLYENMEFFYEAAGVYKALIKRYPESPFATAANFALARLNFSLKRFEDAYDDFSDLLKRQPEGGFSVYAHYYRANALYNLGQPEKALAEYRIGIALDSDFLHRDSLSLYLLGSTYHNLQRYPEAREYFLMMRNLFPNDKNTPQALAKIGEILVLKKSLPEAMLMFTTVVKEFPGSEGDVVSRLKMAILGEDSEIRRKLELINPNYSEFLDSEKGYLYLVEHHPESPFTDIARLDLGRLYFEKGEYEKARLILGEMLDRRLEPGLREAAFTNLRKVIYAEIEEYFKDTKFDLIVALQNEYGQDFLSRPSAVYPFLWIAEALRREGFKVGALNAYREIKRLKPKAGEAQIVDWGIAALLVQMERYDEAEDFLGKINFKRFKPLWRARMLLLRAHIQIYRGKDSDAFTTLRKAKTKLPSSAVKERVEVGTLETDLWLRKSEKIQALDTLRAVVSLSFANPREIEVEQRQLLGYRLARMLYEQKEYSEALSWFMKLALLTPAEELDELLYWQLRCQIALGREAEVAGLVKRMQKEFPGSSWTDSAATASKDFIWQQEKSSLK